MNGTLNKTYGIGALLTFLGCLGLSDIRIDNEIGFWIFAVILSIGLSLCIGSYRNG